MRSREGLQLPGDVNQDAKLDMTDPIHVLRHLFLSGAPPALGTECVPLPGCPAACH